MTSIRKFARPLAAFALLLGAAGAGAATDCDVSVPGTTTFLTESWGITPEGTRLQTQTGINKNNVASLELAWAYGLGTDKPRSWPLVTEDTIFIGDTGKGVVALDRATGCTRWVHSHEGELGSAILPARIGDRAALLFTDRMQGVFLIDAGTGAQIWHQKITEEPIPMYSGTPVIHDDLVLVPISSLEIGLSINPFYGCCTTRGGMAAFDLATGEPRWYLPTIPEPAKPTEKHYLFVQEFGPSGAPVWGSASIDSARGLIYYGTGQNYSRPASETSDAIFAVDIKTGEARWIKQFTAGDAYNISCDIARGHPNCPQPMGPDVDFGAPPVLIKREGANDILIAGQKSGDVHAMDPDTREVLWQVQIGRGGALGGIHWGMAADPALGLVFVPVSDVAAHPNPRTPAPGLYGIDVATGEIRWVHERKGRCEDRVCAGGLSAAITAIPGVIFAGSLDGYLGAYASDSGQLLWSVDTWIDYQTVNGVPASGGAIDSHGPMVADDLVIVSSGYNSFGHKGGNAFLVFKLNKEAAQ